MKIAIQKSHPFSITLLLLFVSIWVWHQYSQTSESAYQKQFELRYKEATYSIKTRMDAYQQVLRGTRGLFDASENVSRDEFRGYVNTLRIEQNFPGIQGIGFSIIVSPEEKESHIASIRALHGQEYDIYPAGDRAFYTSIIFLEPLDERNLRAYGYDMYSNDIRREAMERARDTDTPAMSGKVRLVQEYGEKEQAGFLIYHPVYKNNTLSDTLQNRRANILGWVYAPFRMDDLMLGLFGDLLKDIDVKIYDGVDSSHSSLMFDSSSESAQDFSNPVNDKTQLKSSTQLQVAGHIWTIDAAALPEFYKNLNIIEPKLVLILGIMTSLLSGVILWLYTQGREKIIKQEQIAHLAYYDILTGLPNRALLSDRLSHAILQSKRYGKILAILFLDLDEFKTINDEYGHSVGDSLLIALSRRMKDALRSGDTLARFGGDEFVAILDGLDGYEDARAIIERLLIAASETVVLEDIVVKVSTSIGVTIYPSDDVDAEQLIRHADQAMYHAKDNGKNCYRLFDADQDYLIRERHKALDNIRNALDNKEFVLHYQPKVNMKRGTVVGMEALIRWQHPEKGILPPSEFLPYIENHPMIIEIGEWVIDSVLSQIAKWYALTINRSIVISVNIAAIHLQQDDFTEKLKKLLEKHPKIDPRYLDLEILETSALHDIEHVAGVMNSCMNLGVKFSIDDFGTGYSSLTYLRRLPFNTIKVDQSFVRNMLDDPNDLAIVESVINLAKSFHRNVIAEGVETIEHGVRLLGLGCTVAQGYGIAKPMPPEEVLNWISKWKPDERWKPSIKN